MNTPQVDTPLPDWIMHHVSNSTEWHPFPWHFSIEVGNLHGVMVFLAGCFLFMLFGVLYKKDATKAPSGITHLLEVLVLFVRDEIVYKFLGKEDGRKLAPLFLNFFFFVLIMNIMGLIPLFSTATANFNVTFGLAAITFTLMVGGGIMKNGVGGFFGHFCPSGVPKPILIILAPIEFIGIFIKPAALTIRLFANLLAGHIVIFSLLGLISIIGWLGLPSVAIALFVYVLEVAVAFIQAFVFTLLSAMFVGEMLHPHH